MQDGQVIYCSRDYSKRGDKMSAPFVAFNRLKTNMDKVKYLIENDKDGEILDALHRIREWWEYRSLHPDKSSLRTFCRDFGISYNEMYRDTIKYEVFLHSEEGLKNLLEILDLYDKAYIKDENIFEEEGLSMPPKRSKVDEEKLIEEVTAEEPKPKKIKIESQPVEEEIEDVVEEKPVAKKVDTKKGSGNKIYNDAVKSLQENTDMESIYKDVDIDEEMPSDGGAPDSDIQDIPDGGSKNIGLTVLFITGAVFAIGLTVYLMVKKKKSKMVAKEVEPIVQYPDKEVSAPSYHKVVEINKPEEKEDEYNIPDNLKELIPNRSTSPRSLNDILGGH